MLIGDPLDTLLNLGTFAFIGAMIWIATRKLPTAEAKTSDRDASDRNKT